jgi:hypothetical protein
MIGALIVSFGLGFVGGLRSMTPLPSWLGLPALAG